eukprot:TRINITY_DN43023_c0_g1_i1.p1 TRINITY_DN43023_c0_g1~~TRINITY_DN43023_c0_g1_i1.p1  ORF type:complete len:162 (-),score=20.73 TRINITY_DN43023_c0_g1_i1:41-526(-)
MNKSASQSSFRPRTAEESGVNFLRGSKVGSTTGYISVGGTTLGLPHGRRSKSASGSQVRFTSLSEAQAQFREMPYCYASMDRKPLVPYSPNAPRSRLAIDDAPVPFKNASTIDFNDGIHTCHRKRFTTTGQLFYTGEAADPRTNTGIVSEAVRLRNAHRQK